MITKEEIDHLLELARLEISLEEKEKLTLDVDKILEYINKLSEVNVDNMPETIGGSLNTNIWREDELKDLDFKRDVLMEDIPLRNGNLVVVPNVFEDTN